MLLRIFVRKVRADLAKKKKINVKNWHINTTYFYLRTLSLNGNTNLCTFVVGVEGPRRHLEIVPKPFQ